jgi:hypothetical protein
MFWAEAQIDQLVGRMRSWARKAELSELSNAIRPHTSLLGQSLPAMLAESESVLILIANTHPITYPWHRRQENDHMDMELVRNDNRRRLAGAILQRRTRPLLSNSYSLSCLDS